ncbi:MAG: DUF4261 domain-containing protein [Lachnospiraceae bacterium]|nr:DUF4261 domain-containing protein [Lachnospiraceae bacterium]
MMLFKKSKKEKEENVFNQDLSQKENPGYVFVMVLFMKEKCPMPDREKMTTIMQKHLGKVECFTHSDNAAGFAANNYRVEFEQGAIPPQLMITGCTKRPKEPLDELTVSQMWDCQEDRERILSECKYQVLATDMMAAVMDYRERADMLMDYMEALVELYPTCEAVYFMTSGKMFTVERIRNHNIPRDKRFLYFAVNVRFFNIQGTDDMLVDTLGMTTLFLPDLQYHFHGMNPDWVVNHAYNMLSYIYDNENPIKDNDSIDGIKDGNMSRDVMWICHYEDSLIQPARGILDIYMNEYAAGGRAY